MVKEEVKKEGGEQGQGQKKSIVREQFEWSNHWWSNANDLSIPRVLLIGDSISCGYSPVVTKILADKVHVDRLANSRLVSDPTHMKESALFVDEYDYKVIHFNNGLHGQHASDEEYGQGLRKYVELLLKKSKSAKLIWAASTPITLAEDSTKLDEKKNAQVISRNKIAAEIMDEYKIPINDLYSLVVGNADVRVGDGYHYNEAGSKLLGEQVAEVIAANL